MRGLILPRKKRLYLPSGQVPRIDWSHPLTNGLALSYVSVGTPVPYKLAGKYGGIGAGTVLSSPQGPAVYGGYTANLGFKPAASTPYSIALVSYINNFGYTDLVFPLWFGAAGINNNDGWGFGFQTRYGSLGYTPQWSFQVYQGGVSVTAPTNASHAYSTNYGIDFAVFTFDGSTGTLYLNSTTTTASGNFVPTSYYDNNIPIQFGWGSGTALLAAAWGDRALSAAEAQTFINDPYGFLIFPEDERRWALAGVNGGGGNVNVSLVAATSSAAVEGLTPKVSYSIASASSSAATSTFSPHAASALGATSATGAVKALTPSVSAPLAAVASSSAVGSLSSSISFTLTAAETTAAFGNFNPVIGTVVNLVAATTTAATATFLPQIEVGITPAISQGRAGSFVFASSLIQLVSKHGHTPRTPLGFV